MRRYSIFQALPLSFFSRDLYRDVAATWRGIGIVYLLVLVLLTTLLVVVRVKLAFDGWARGPAAAIAEQVPKIVIRHRVVEVDRPMPVVLTDSASNTELAVIDTTGQVASLDGLEARVLVTATHVIYRKSATETRMFDLRDIKDFTVDSVLAKRWLRLLSAWAAPAILPFVFLGLLFVRFLQQVVLATLGLLVARLVNARLGFEALLRLAAVALTPALLIEPLLEMAKARPPFWGWLWCGLTLGLMVWAVRANGASPEVAGEGTPAPPPSA